MATIGIKKQSVSNARTHQSDKGVARTSAPAVSDKRLEQNSPAPACEQIAGLAYAYWEARNGAGGSAEDDWLRAERELALEMGQGLAPKLRRRRAHSRS